MIKDYFKQQLIRARRPMVGGTTKKVKPRKPKEGTKYRVG